ncbi:MAG: SCO family protein [Bacteroidota bacterium]
MYRLLLAVFLLGGCQTASDGSLPFYQSPARTPEWISPAEVTHRVGAFSLTNQDGRTITEADLEGRIYIANFFFASCSGICPTMRSNLAAVQAAFAGDERVLILSHSVLPAQDSVDNLRAYATINEVDSRSWHLLTGDQAQIYDLARRSYFADVSDAAPVPGRDLLHTETVVLVDQHGRVRGLYNGTLKFDVQQLIKDVRTLKS